eukprot:scaffold91303_cov42-Cyclotella_meneghiniana.AAC.1
MVVCQRRLKVGMWLFWIGVCRRGVSVGVDERPNSLMSVATELDCVWVATVVGGVEGVEVSLVMMVSGCSVLGLVWFGSGGGSISCNIRRSRLDLSTVVNLLDFSMSLVPSLLQSIGTASVLRPVLWMVLLSWGCGVWYGSGETCGLMVFVRPGGVG